MFYLSFAVQLNLINTTGDILMQKYKQAVADRNIQVKAHRGLTETIGEEFTSQ